MSAPYQVNETAFAHFLPWWWIGDDALVCHDGSMAIGYRLLGVDVACQTDEQLNLITQQLRSLLNAVPPGYQLQFLRDTKIIEEKAFDGYLHAIATSNEILREQRRRNAKHLASLKIRRFESHLILSKPRALGPLGSHRSTGVTKLLDRLFSKRDPYTLTVEDHNRAIDDLNHLGETLTHYLAGTGTKTVRLSDQELLALCYAPLNPTRSRTSPVPVLCDDLPSQLPDGSESFCSAVSLREQLVHSGMSWDVDLFYLDDPLRLHRVMGLKSLPPRTRAALINGTIKIPFEHRLSIGVKVPDSERAYDDVDRRRKRAFASAAGHVRNVRAQEQFQQLEEVMRAMTSRDQRFFEVSLHLSFGADTLSDLDRRTREAIEVFRGLSGTVVQTEQFSQLPSFLGMLPGAAHYAPHARKCLTDNVADLLPIYQTDSGDQKPTFSVVTKANELYSIDITDPRRTNWNYNVFGQSGGGKTFLVLELATSSMLGQGAPLIVIDIGGREDGSYYRLVKMLGGDFVDLSLDGTNAINPFYSRHDLYTTDIGEPSKEPNELKLAFLVGITKLLVTDPGAQALTTIQEGILSKSILEAYRRVGDERPPLFSDLAAELENLKSAERDDKSDARHYARTLRAWIDGPMGKVINQQSRVNVKSNFVVFDMKGIENIGRLAPVIIMIVSAYVWNMIARPRNTLAWVIYDECWKLLMNETAAALQSELYRTARKLRAGVISVTQKLEDFLAAPASRAILSNTATTFLLKHKDGHQQVAELLGLNSREIELFKQLRTEKGRFSEFFYKSEKGSAVLRLCPSPIDYWLNTTDPADKELERSVIKKLKCTGLVALRHLAAEYPHGASARAKE